MGAPGVALSKRPLGYHWGATEVVLVPPIACGLSRPFCEPPVAGVVYLVYSVEEPIDWSPERGAEATTGEAVEKAPTGALFFSSKYIVSKPTIQSHPLQGLGKNGPGIRADSTKASGGWFSQW